MLITDPKVKKAKEAISRVIESQLRSAFQTATGETLTDAHLHSLTLLWTPEDDCWTQVPELVVRSELVELGEEGAEITVEKIVD